MGQPFHRIIRTALGAACVAAGFAMSSAIAEPMLVVKHQGVDRVATLYRPPNLPAGPVRLVVALHGLGQSVESLRRWLHLDAVAQREGFVVVYPEAVERWNYGRPIHNPMPQVNGKTVDDVGFIREMIDGLIEAKIADPRHVYVTGMSRGGLMTFALICALADRLAAAAPLITGMTDHQRESCRPARSIPIMVIAGTDDEAQRYDGQVTRAGRLLSIPETMEFWRQHNDCSQESVTSLPHRDSSDPTRVRLTEWTSCRNYARLRLYRVNDGGHQLPSFSPSSEWNTKHFGLRNRDIETADEFWTFTKGLSGLKPR